MAAYNKINNFVNLLGTKVVDLRATGDTFKVMLTNSSPNATMTIKSDLTELPAASGYVAGGYDIQNDFTTTSGTGSMTAIDVTITATTGTIGPFRYAVIYDDTVASPVKPLMCWADYGSSISLNPSESVVIDFATTLWTLF